MDLRARIENPRVLAALYVALAVIAMIQAHVVTSPGAALTSYNNLIIFRQSFTHLLHGQPLYAAYPLEYWDLYKYSPTFALFSAPLWALPLVVAHLAWNLLNVGFVLWGLQRLAILTTRQKAIVLLFAAIEMMTSLQNEQSNGLVAGLLIMAFAMSEERRPVWAAFFIVACAFVKVFGLAALTLLALYPGRARAALAVVGWSALFFAAPLLVTSPSELVRYYQEWGRLLRADQFDPNAFSVMNVLRTWFGLHVNQTATQLLGAMLLGLPCLLILSRSTAESRLRALASVMIWVVIFNHKAESPTFVIAALGIGLWYSVSVRSALDTALVVFAFVFTVLIATDVFPGSLRTGFFRSHMVKAIPCIVIWVWIWVQQCRDGLEQWRDARTA